MKNSYSEHDFKKDLKALESMVNFKGGAAKENKDARRHFKIVELNGKEVDFGTAEVAYKTKTGNPISDAPSRAAKKLLSSIAQHKGLKKQNKLKLHSTYVIKEITRGKKDKKMHGPYVGKFKELTNKEKKSAVIHTKSGKAMTPFTMKPVVHLKKEKDHKSEMKERNHKSEKRGG